MGKMLDTYRLYYGEVFCRIPGCTKKVSLEVIPLFVSLNLLL